MANEAALPAIGWLALSSLPAIGLLLDRKTGLAIGGISAALIAAGPALVKSGWNQGASLEAAFSGTGYLLSIAPFFLLRLPVGLSEGGTAGATLFFLIAVAAAVILQAYSMHRWGKEALLRVLGAEIALLGSCWITRSYLMPVKIELGYTGIIEVMGYMNSIMVCALSALFIIAFAKWRKHTLSV
jgi:hypothetical protein